jgi:acyl transferase domain-containing protein
MIGHSVGEYVAACLAGVFSLQDALTLIAERGRLMQSMPSGSMIAVALPEHEVVGLLGNDLSVAAVNEPFSCVVSGPTDRIEQLEARLAQTDVSYRRLHTSHAFHSPMMEPVLDRFTDFVSTVELQAPQIPYVSNVSGRRITAAETTDPRYWAKQLRLPVRFAQGLETLLEDPERVLLEVGPGRSLTGFALRHPAKKNSQLAVSSLRHPQERQADTEFLLNALGQLWASGVEIDWTSYHGDEKRLRLHLPIYPFEQKRYWVETQNSGAPSVMKKHDIAEWFYTPSWKYTVAPESRLGLEPQNQKSRWLIFEDECGLSSVFSEHLLELGCVITTVKTGERFLKLRPQRYEINPKRFEDYLALFKDLAATRNLPDNIGHLSSVTPQDQDSSFDDFDHQQTIGLHSVLLIAQALIKENVQSGVQIAVISNHIHNVTGHEQICPNKTTALAACKAIPQEYPNLGCRNLDIVLPAEPQDREKLAEQLAAELMSGSLDPVVAYRGGQRWVQVFEPMRLEAAPEISPMLREGGVYLITGGMGNIGMVLAEELAASVQAKLALVGRSAFPKRSQWTEWLLAHGEDNPTSQKILRLQGFESLGAEVMVFSADLADEEKMREVIAEIHKHWGSLNGLIHGAGNLSEDSFFAIDQASPELCERQFHSKIRGLVTLETVLSGSNLDFWLLLSSVSSVLAGLGYVAYSAANIFLDACAFMKSQSSGVPWLSINWDTWDFREVGKENGTALAMFPEEGVEAFRRILSLAPLPQVVVSTGELEARIDQWINLKSLRERAKPNSRESTSLPSPRELSNPYMAPRNEIERTIAEIWQESLGVAQVGVLDNYFTDLSGSSLLATQLVARLRSKFHVEFPLRRFLEAPTVADLAVAIERILRGAAPEAKSA